MTVAVTHRRVRCGLVVALAASVAVVVPHAVHAQRPRTPAVGSLSGQVVNAGTGRALPGAEVRLAGPDTVIVHANARGEWLALALPAGRYALRARMIGYAAVEQPVQVVEGHTATRALRLEAAPLALDQIVVTAARREQRLADAVTTTELVTRADIERSGASDLASVLLEQTGIELQGGHPAGAGVMLQGLGSERVLVLLDGQPIAGRISGVFDVSRIPTAMVERVEVVKGPQSTLYGTDAMGGVINVITRTPPTRTNGTLGASLTATAGTQARRDGSANLTLGRGAFASLFDVSRRSTETTPGVASSRGALARRLDGAWKLRWAPDSPRRLEASLLALDERQRWRSGTFYNFGDNVQWSGRLSGAWQRDRHELLPTFSASVFDHLSRGSTEPRPIAGDTGQRQIQRTYQAELLYNGHFGAAGALALDVGAQLRRDETESVRVPGGLRSIISVEPFAQLEIGAGSAVSVVPGVRVSRSSQWGTHVTPRLAARYRVGDRLTLRASAGKGYRAPDFKELYMFFQNTSAGYAVRGNPDLRPEASRNVTIGTEWADDRMYLRGQLFRNDFRDFIETRPITPPGEPPVYQYGNVEDGSTRGVELETGAALRGFRLEGSYNGLATRDDATGRPLLGRPTHAARATLGSKLPLALRASLTSVFTGRTPMRREATTGVVTSWRDAFLRLDARVARSLSGPFGPMELVVGAANVFDQQPAEWAAFTGRHLYTALSWTLTSNSRTDAK